MECRGGAPNICLLDGASANHYYPVILDPRKKYRWSAKRIGGDATSAAWIVGTTRLSEGVAKRLANKDRISPAYDPDDDAIRVTTLNPWNKYFDGGPIANVVDQPDATYDYYLDLDGVRALSIQLDITIGGGTVTVRFRGTTWDDGTADSGCTYVDVTNAMYGAATFTASGMMFDSGRLAGQFKYGKIEVIKAGGGVATWRIDPRGID